MSTKNSGSMAGVVIVLVIVAVGVWYAKMYPKQVVPSSQTEEVVPVVKGEVVIMKNTFSPDPITIKVDETVTWVNEESYGHDIVSDDGLFRSPKMATGDKFSYTFTKEGVYPYICGIHPFMKGTITVTK